MRWTTFLSLYLLASLAFGKAETPRLDRHLECAGYSSGLRGVMVSVEPGLPGPVKSTPDILQKLMPLATLDSPRLISKTLGLGSNYILTPFQIDVIDSTATKTLLYEKVSELEARPPVPLSLTPLGPNLEGVITYAGRSDFQRSDLRDLIKHSVARWMIPASSTDSRILNTLVFQANYPGQTAFVALAYHDGIEDCLNYATPVAKKLSLSKAVPSTALPYHYTQFFNPQALQNQTQGTESHPEKDPNNYTITMRFVPPLKNDDLIVNEFYGPRLKGTLNPVMKVMDTAGDHPESQIPLIVGSQSSNNTNSAGRVLSLLRNFERHTGTDLHAIYKPVYSVADGTFLYIGHRSCPAGNVVVIKHDIPNTQDFVISEYMHLSDRFPQVVISKKTGEVLRLRRPGEPLSYNEGVRSIKFGDPVKAGDFIAVSGAPCGTKHPEPHLHLEMRVPKVNAPALKDVVDRIRERDLKLKDRPPINSNSVFQYVFFFTSTVNAADYIEEIDDQCQKRKTFEMKNAMYIQKFHKLTVPPLTSGYCSQEFERKLNYQPGVYALFKQSSSQLKVDYQEAESNDDGDGLDLEAQTIEPNAPLFAPVSSPQAPSAISKPLGQLLLSQIFLSL